MCFEIDKIVSRVILNATHPALSNHGDIYIYIYLFLYFQKKNMNDDNCYNI